VEPTGIDLAQWWRDPNAMRILQSEYAKYLASLIATALDKSQAASDEPRDARADEPRS